ncbi:ABC transporter permease [Paludibacterium purpuratum]|nr:ABC transporter permease [Paludibacterium purpuratum]
MDILRFLQSPWRIVLTLVQPLLYLFIFGAALQSGTYAEMAGYQSYLYPGILCMIIMFSAVSAAISLVHDREAGFLRALLVSRASRWEIALGKIMSGTAQALLQSLLVLPFGPLLGVGITPPTLMMLLIEMLLIAMTFSAIGLMVALPFRSVLVFPVMSNLVLLPMFFLSGALYPIDLAPRWVGALAKLDPATYAVDLLRGRLCSIYLQPALTSSLILTAGLTVASLVVITGFYRAGNR